MSGSLGLLNCSVCDCDLLIQGKIGAMIKTVCPCCDLSSDLFSNVLLDNVGQNKTPEAEESEVEIYHLRK